VSALESFPYDLVLMDTRMPEMNGFEAARAIRETEERQREEHSQKSRSRGVPIIAMAGDSESVLAEKILDFGMDDALSKPVEPQRLVEVIERWLAEP